MAGTKDQAPEQLIVEFYASSGQPVTLADLGPEFIRTHGLDHALPMTPYRVAMTKKGSKAGNAYYDYSQNGVPFPDGLSTFIRVAGVIIPMGRVRPSQKGYPTREGTAQVIVGNMIYSVTIYLTESRDPYYVKVLAHKTPDRTANIKKAQASPRGGHIIT